MSMPKQREILLCESDGLLADVTAFRLELLGYPIRVAGSLHALLESLSERLPDLLIVDVSLPDCEGTECIRRLRALYPEEQLPILVFSVDPSLEMVERAYLAGAQDYLITPFDPTVLEEKIHTLLQENSEKHLV
jgi:DNA-binding response OmpR family regulator